MFGGEVAGLGEVLGDVVELPGAGVEPAEVVGRDRRAERPVRFGEGRAGPTTRARLSVEEPGRRRIVRMRRLA
ncbi:hypothetical protein [Nocardia implantans]|uniref:Uncharacterized protein n=1 Tax=Nocardia implantans TaxID=3108168 RepID=A0ABU6ASB4_9NOCA|nr:MULTISPECIES: hypothetical protein [unclassified Nocardia]MBF6191775.1 hypothetical protein [Nocardia beijingensis]MEA3527914.1 hypothetical protein [Nocardia sp. CDC192]MEB3510334.1 hypothetical protein [Nocardia sp. CDC186]